LSQVLERVNHEDCIHTFIYNEDSPVGKKLGLELNIKCTKGTERVYLFYENLGLMYSWH
jgi:hypothetical protein